MADDINDNGVLDDLERKWIEQTHRNRVRLEGGNARDVTEEVDRALDREINKIHIKPFSSFQDLINFYIMVRTDGPWDIKTPDAWAETIGTEFPGSYDTVVIYHDNYTTPEELGNYTYGALGRAYGFSLLLLINGSNYAAGFPEPGTREYENESKDILFIANGYERRH